MHGRHVAAGARRAKVHSTAVVLARRPLPASCLLAAAATPLRRSLATGANFHGFFGGGGQQMPPRGDTEKFYRLLGTEKGASEAQIKQAYKKQAMKHHPDRGGDENAFKEISRAYEVLSNPEKRQIYDTYGEDGLEGTEQGTGAGPAGGMDPFDLFSHIFGFDVGGRRSGRGRPVTPDSTYELQLSLEDFYLGTTRSIRFNRDVLCGSCKGQGGHDVRQCSRCKGTGRQIHFQQSGLFVQQMESLCGSCAGRGYVIPPSSMCKSCKGKCTVKETKTFSIDIDRGLEENAQFRFQGAADEAPGHDSGDVVIIIQQKTHKVFQRVKDSLVMLKKVTLSEALCGFQFSTTFLDGEELIIRSSPGQVVRPGDTMVISGKGMPRQPGKRTGDLFLILDVEFPSSLPPGSQDKLSELLGGKSLPQAIPPGVQLPQKLTPRQEQELSRLRTESAQKKRAPGHGQGGDMGCAQQ